MAIAKILFEEEGYHTAYLQEIEAYIKEESMENYFTLGPTPRDESCACVGEDDYVPRARAECRRFITLLRKKFGPTPEGARFAIKDFFHDFGTYYEVVICFDEDMPESIEYALRCEDNLPATWDDDQPVPQFVKDA